MNLVKTFLSITIILIISSGMYAQFGGGLGTRFMPYHIESAEHIANLATSVSAGTDYYRKFFILVNNIDFENYDGNGNNYFSDGHPGYNKGLGWMPIGSDIKPFNGNFSGQGYIINGLFINSPDSCYLGLFGKIEAGSINQLGLTNVNVTGDYSIGGLVGYAENSIITSCHVTGSVNSKEDAGGLAGYVYDTDIIDCHAIVDVNVADYNGGALVGYNSGIIKTSYSFGTVTSPGSYTGGLVGCNSNQIIECFSSASVTADEYAGGLVGSNDYGKITNSYSDGSVSGNQYIGGLVGDNYYGKIVNCYTASQVSGNDFIGGFAASNTGTDTSSLYWDKDCAGIQTSAIGHEISGWRSLQHPPFMEAGWDFDSIWAMTPKTNNGFPYLINVNPWFIGNPLAHDASEITATGFTANWGASDNAEGYLLFVSNNNFVSCIDGYNGYSLNDTSSNITGLTAGVTYQYRVKAFNQNFETEYSNAIAVNLGMLASVFDDYTADRFVLYPNPAGCHIQLNTTAKIDILEIYSLTGTLLLSKVLVSDVQTMDISSLSEGFYLVKIFYGNQKNIQKLRVKR